MIELSQIKIWGIHKKYPAMTWWENFMGGHITLGPITVFGSNAMAWAVNIKTRRWGYICFSLPSIHWLRKKKGHYFYLSPNATPWASTLYFGKDKEERLKSNIRRVVFGHGFNTAEYERELSAINQFVIGVINYPEEMIKEKFFTEDA